MQFELRVECYSIVKTEEGITAGQVHRLYRGVVVWGKLQVLRKHGNSLHSTALAIFCFDDCGPLPD